MPRRNGNPVGDIPTWVGLQIPVLIGWKLCCRRLAAMVLLFGDPGAQLPYVSPASALWLHRLQ